MKPRASELVRRTSRLSLIASILVAAMALLVTACDDGSTETPDDDMATGGDTSTTGDSTDPGDTTTTGDSTNPGDTTPPGDTTEPPPGTVREPAEADAEYRDCLAGCTHDFPAYTFDWRTNDALRGVIDGNCHEREGFPNGTSDVDWIGLTADARTMLEITVAPTDGSQLDPVIETNSGVFIMTYSNDRAPGDKAARTTLAGPFIEALPFYVAIYDFQNYLKFDPGSSCDDFVGGDNYGYELTVREIPFEPVDLGTLDAGGSTTGSGTVAAPGDIVYLKFVGPADATPSVTVNRTGSTQFQLAVGGMNTIQGQLAFKGPLKYENPATISLTQTDFDVCRTDCAGMTAEYYFAVTDFDGLGGSDYTFEVEVQL